MKSSIIKYGFEALSSDRRRVVTIGSFDGVHEGHRILLDHLKAMARRLDAESVVVTFDPHPRIAMGRDEGMGLLTTVEERALLLEAEGIDHLVVAHFDEEFRMQPYSDFVTNSLVARLGMCGMIVGYNHRLGRGSEGNYERLVPIAESHNFELECVPQHRLDGAKVSSTVVREVIAKGDMECVAELLGHRYVVVGDSQSGVVDVANTHKILPPDGRYVATIEQSGHTQSIGVDIKNRRIHIKDIADGEVVITL